jgi:Rrf2 family protein
MVVVSQLSHYGLERSDAALRTAGFVILAVVMRPIGGWLSDRLHPVPILIAAYTATAALAVIASLELPLIPVGTIAFLGIAAALGAGTGAVFALVARLVEAERGRIGDRCGRRCRWARWILPAPGHGPGLWGARRLHRRVSPACSHRRDRRDLHRNSRSPPRKPLDLMSPIYAGPVDLALTRKGDYAVRAALHLAKQWPDRPYIKIREVAAAMALPAGYTPRVLKILAEAGLAEARAGRQGGYRLTAAPETISLLVVVEAAEGSFTLDRCILRGGPCHWGDACAVHTAWATAMQACRESLRGTNLADLVRADDALRQSPGTALRPGSRDLPVY